MSKNTNTKINSVVALAETGVLSQGAARVLVREYRAMDDKAEGYGLKRARVAHVLAKRKVRADDGGEMTGRDVADLLGIAPGRVSQMAQECALVEAAGFSLAFKGDPSAPLLAAYRAAQRIRKTSVQGGEGEGKEERDARNATLRANAAKSVADKGGSDYARAEALKDAADSLAQVAKDSKSPKPQGSGKGAQDTAAEKSAPSTAPDKGLLAGVNAAYVAVEKFGGTMDPAVLDAAAERVAALAALLAEVQADVAAAREAIAA